MSFASIKASANFNKFLSDKFFFFLNLYIIDKLKVQMSQYKFWQEKHTQPENCIQRNLKQDLISGFALKRQQNQFSSEIRLGQRISEDRLAYQLQSESNASTSQQNMPNQSEILNIQEIKQNLLQKMNKLYDSLSKEHPHIFQSCNQIDESPQTEEVEDYILRVHTNQKQNEVARLLNILQQNESLRQFLQWIFDASPLLFYEELIIITCRIILISFSSNKIQTLKSMINLSRNMEFLQHISDGNSLKVLKIPLQNGNSNHYATNDLFFDFLSYYAETVLKISSKCYLKQQFTQMLSEQAIMLENLEVQQSYKFKP